MDSFGTYLRSVREEKEMSINQLALYSGVSAPQISRIETGSRGTPKPETIRKLSEALKIPYEEMMKAAGYLVDEEEKPYYVLTEKDEADIAKRLEAMMNDLESDSALAFMGEPMDEEDRELLRLSLENALRMSKQMAKKKFTPKKYRDK
ncbi:helix-turn-helix transcriptional regulator [Paenibacillus thiaminolyticus]|nr:helix-turn-helix transcriptional regulator [Paenibacillus thiaminolyticus]MDG0871001.1 helix-turn-helix domain-containing protein [Paenibacillus thiaminolyticus]NGP62671.1 helix-turn-helix transcriptional regulator [Paenibacillus thiaminolyticus]NGP62724.1 helix-turn-helix transcriptional regulator [Paenibacillus thiaminolyticus]WII39667.1 helix-turn-helix transcriptional regulator [Paenibacillus thiaminolyticus]